MNKTVRYVEIPKNVHCPKWNVNITLYGKYYLSDDADSSIGKFALASCPIAQNNNKPLRDQDSKYKILRCLEYQRCPLLNDFPEKIDTYKISRII